MKTCIPPELVQKLKESLEKGQITPDSIISMLPEERVALKSILEDFVSDKLGVSIKDVEVKTINEKAKRIDEAQQRVGSDLGNPEKLQENLEFFRAKKAMDDYLQEISPANRLKVITGTIGRGMMLFSLKSPILNIGSNFEVGLTEAISRRISNSNIKPTDNQLFRQYISFTNKIYKETGYDVSRMTNIKDAGTNGERVLGTIIHSQGPGAVRKVGRVVEDLIFKKLMGAPDTAFSSFHFADSVNLNSLSIAKGDKIKAKEIMKDSMRLEPLTPEGEIIRTQGILDAQTATWTNTTWASRVSGGIQKILNDVSGDLRVGDYLLPFIKTPANVIATGMDYAGFGIPKALYKTFKGLKNGEVTSKEYVQSISRDVVRAGLGITGALIVTSQLSDDDFVGAYDPKRTQIEALRGSNYNAIRVGNKWISTDWLGPLAVTVTAVMYARNNGNTLPEKLFQYGKGVLSSALNIPGISDIYDTVKNNAFKKNQTLEEMTGATADYFSAQIYSRLVPSFISDLAKATDPYVRETGQGVQGIKAKIPFVSQTLQPKKNIFGSPIKGEGPISDILFGSRVKTDKETALVKELSSISDATDKGIAFTDWNKSSSKTLAQFKERVGEEKFEEARIKYGKELQTQLEKTINDPRYSRLSDEDKLKVITGKDTDAIDKILRQYGFRYRYLPSTRIPKNL